MTSPSHLMWPGVNPLFVSRCCDLTGGSHVRFHIRTPPPPPSTPPSLLPEKAQRLVRNPRWHSAYAPDAQDKRLCCHLTSCVMWPLGPPPRTRRSPPKINPPHPACQRVSSAPPPPPGPCVNTPRASAATWRANCFKQQLHHQSERRKYGRGCWVREKPGDAKWQMDRSEFTGEREGAARRRVELRGVSAAPSLCLWLFVSVLLTRPWIWLSFCALWPAGEGVVPEQEDEVEKGEGRPAGGGGSGERTGEREKGNFAAVRVLRHRRAPPLHGLLSQRGQSRQRPELRARPLMMQPAPLRPLPL